jgi:plastocyanin
MKGDRVKKTLVVLLALVALLGVACGGSDDDGGDTSAPAPAEEEDDDGGAATLTAANFAFDPPSLTAAAGGTIEFTNEDDTVHSFTIDDSDVDEDADGGAATTVDLGSLEAGSYDFYCKYHKDSMTGTLEVTG